MTPTHRTRACARAHALACWAAVTAFPLAVSAEYSWQIAGLGEHAEEKRAERLAFEEVDSKSDVVSLSATYHFDAVEDESGPRALAAFLDPASRISVSAARAEESTQIVRIPSGDVDFEFEAEQSDYTVSGEYLFSRSNWYVGGLYSEGDLKTDPSIDSNPSHIGYGVTAGKYLGAGTTRIALALRRGKTEAEVSSVAGFAMQETTDDTVTLDVMHVLQYSSATYALLAGVSQLSSDGFVFFTPADGLPSIGSKVDLGERRAYRIAAELFVHGQVGLRIGYTRFDGTTSEDDSIELGASWFFCKTMGLELALSRDGSRPSPEIFVGRPPPLPTHTDRATLRVIGRL